MISTRFRLLTAFAWLVTAASASAGPLEDRFHELDGDKDGRVSLAELQDHPALHALDLNGDGFVLLEEAREGMKTLRRGAAARRGAGTSASSTETVPIEIVFRHFDTNADSRLTRDELPDAALFARLDGDKDGAVVLEEARSVLGHALPKRDLPPNVTGPPIPRPDATLTEQPLILKPTEHGVGHLVPDLALLTLEGQSAPLSRYRWKLGTVVALFSATCPISGKLGPEYARLEKLCAESGLGFILISAVPGDTVADLRKYAADHGLHAPVLQDPSAALLTALAATTTTEVFLLDAAHTLAYRGAVHDQYGLGYSKPAPTQPYLRTAMTQLMAGERIRIAATTAPGCALDLHPAAGVAASTTAPQAASVTYHHQIARIMQAHCIECHRTDGLGPFSLETLADVTDHAAMIRKQVERGVMPPWFAARTGNQQADTPWANDCSLSARDKADLLAWLASPDRPAGDPAHAPIPRKFAGAWTIGTPDATFTLPRPIAVQAEGTMPYQRATITTTFPEERWVQAYEIRPTAPQVVHHVIVRVHEKGRKVVDSDEGGDGYWAAYVPGNTYRIMPPGHARRLPAGATISFQIHYTPNGKATEDQLQIGLIFAKEPPKFEVKVAAVAHPKLRIPPGEANHVEVRQQPIPFDMLFSGFMAHMHLRGKAFKYEVTYPDGKSETLLDIPRYDFNWQLAYDYKQPKFIPRGSVIKITAAYDNSPANPANPDPTKTVRWGAQTYDEMMIGYVEHYVPLAPPATPTPAPAKPVAAAGGS